MRTLLTLAWWTLMTPITGVITLPWAALTGDSDFLYRLGMWVVRVGVVLSGIRVQMVGREKLQPGQNYIFMSNHVSNIDPPLLIPLLPPRTSVLVKKELFRIPILGYAMRVAKMVPVDRENREAAVASVHAAAEVVRQGLHMTVFPEGTRSRDGRLLPFKKGHMEALADDILPKGKFFIRPRKAVTKIIFHDPVWPKDFPDRDALVVAVRDSIASALRREKQ